MTDWQVQLNIWMPPASYNSRKTGRAAELAYKIHVGGQTDTLVYEQQNMVCTCVIIITQVSPFRSHSYVN